MKNFLTKFAKVTHNQKSSAGFTLIELLVAASITTIVIGLTGFGVVAITSKNKEAKSETERRVELNRALDFIADEVRQAKPIATNASTNLSTVAPNFSSTSKTPVLTLQIPGVSERVIYYIESSSSPWLGPKVISRWGPTFLANGTYSNPTSPASWQGQPLVDLIADTTASATTCSTTGWTANPSVNNGQGFTACVDPNGRIADIRIRGRLTDAYGSTKTTTFQVSTKAFARPYNASFATGPGGGGPGPGGTVTITEPSTAYFEILGGAIACNGVNVATTTTVKVTPPGGSMTSTVVNSSTKALNLPPAVAGTKITVSGLKPLTACSGVRDFNSEADKGSAGATQQVWTLRNGDTPPNFAPLGNQPTIDTFLTKYLDANGKVKLAENQVIYLFELGATDATSTAYDMQDLVVLATIVPN